MDRCLKAKRSSHRYKIITEATAETYNVYILTLQEQLFLCLCAEQLNDQITKGLCGGTVRIHLFWLQVSSPS